MTNEEIYEWMQRDLDGDLSQLEQQMLHSLLRSDPELQLKYNRLKTVSLQLEQLPPVVPPFSIVDSILPKLETAVATPADKSGSKTDDLPALKVKELKSSQPVQISKRKRMIVWLTRISSTAVAACLLIGMMFMGNHSNQHEENPYQQGSVVTPPPAVKQVPLGPTPPPPSTNSSDSVTTGEEKKKENRTSPPKKQKTTTNSTSKQPVKTPAAKPNPKPAVAKPVVPPKPVVKEEKRPAFPYGLEEKSDDDKDDKEDRSKNADKDDDDDKEDQDDKDWDKDNQGDTYKKNSSKEKKYEKN